jgi:hypothetical protein
VKIANSYFEEHRLEFQPDDRRTFANETVKRAEALGVKVAGEILKYAGEEYGPHIQGELRGRIAAFESTPRAEGYQVLLEKVAELAPAVMYEMLVELDHRTGLDLSYGRPVVGFREPACAVFGKTAAAEPFSWTGEGSHHLSEETLRAHADQAPSVDHIFGKGFSQRYVRDPVPAFKGLDDTQKVVLSRLANGAAYRSIF